MATGDPPDPILTHINDICYNARTTWYTYISVVLFVFLALLGVSDKDFFEFGARMQLPFIESSVPIVNFFVSGSAFILLLYTYLHVKLEKLWRAIGQYGEKQPPATPALSRVKQVQVLSERVYPWPVIGASICPHNTAHGLQQARFYITHIAFWVSGPLAIGCFWFKSWAYHDEVLTLYLGIVLTVALGVLCSSIQHVRHHMIRDHAAPRPLFQWTTLMAIPLLALYATLVAIMTGYARWSTLFWPVIVIGLWLLLHHYRRFRHERGWKHVDPGSTTGRAWWWSITALAGFVVVILSWETTEGTLDCPLIPPHSSGVTQKIAPSLMARQRLYCHLKYGGKTKRDREANTVSMTTGLGQFRYRIYNGIWSVVQEAPLLKLLAGLPLNEKHSLNREAPLLWPADLRGAIFTRLPRDWEPWHDRMKDARDPAPAHIGKDCQDSDIERLRVNLLDRIPKRKQRHVDLRRANLTGAILVGQNLEYARLDGAQLREANFELANLSDASMRGSMAQRAAFPSAILSGANMHGIILENAVLHSTCMYEANLSKAALEDTDMRGAIATKAIFHEATLIGINAEGARFKLTELAGATLSGDRLTTIDLENARLRGANLCLANLSKAKNIPSLDGTYGCRNTALPDDAYPPRQRPATWHQQRVPNEHQSKDLFRTWQKTLTHAQAAGD